MALKPRGTDDKGSLSLSMNEDGGHEWRKLGRGIRHEWVFLLPSSPPLSAYLPVSYCTYSPEFEVSSSPKVRCQLLDEGKEHRLGEWARRLSKDLGWVHCFTHVQHQVQVSSCQRLGIEQGSSIYS